MRRALFSLLIGAALLAGIPAEAFWQSRDSNYNISIASGATYTGPGDVVSGATAWYGPRAYNAAYAATPGKSVNVRRASDNVACDVNVATTGGLGLTTSTCNSSTQAGITPSAFAGTDATASCTLATTTATCTGASSTPHVGSTVAGASLTQPCLITAVGTFTGGAGTFTTSLAGTSTSCGTISVGETFTMTYGLFVTEAYDQSGNGLHVLQATAGKQPQLLPDIGNGLPSLSGISANNTGLIANSTPTIAQPLTISAVAEYTVQADTRIFSLRSGSPAPFLSISATANTGYLYDGTPTNFTLSINVNHAIQGVFNGASSVAYVDGSSTSVNPGTSSTQNDIGWMIEGGNVASMTGYSSEAGFWPVGFTPTQAANMRTNQKNFWGTP